MILSRPKIAPFPFNYKHTNSETAIIELFGGESAFKRSVEKVAEDSSETGIHSDVFFCFTNRSGSNFLARLMRSTGRFPLAEEVFNHDAVRRRSESAGSTDFLDYCRMIRNTTSTGSGVSAAKVSWHQLYFLCQFGLIPGVFKFPKFIFIQRRDILGQAISFSIAQQTGAWIKRQDNNAPEPEFDEAGILRFMERITVSNARFEAFFALFKPKVCNLYYEDLAADPEGEIRRVLETLELAGDGAKELLGIDTGKIGIKKQRNEHNAEFRQKMEDKYFLP